jgi:predicted HTH transcriptional regulator
MAIKDPTALLKRLCLLPEAGWLEFKENNAEPDMVGRTLAALANSAMLEDRDKAYLVFGVQDSTKRLVGTSIGLSERKIGGEDFLNWLTRMLEPRLLIECVDFECEGMNFTVLMIEPTFERPVAFGGTEYLRIGSNVKKLREFPNHERSLWLATSRRKFEQSVAVSNQSATVIEQTLDIESYYRLLNLELPSQQAEVLRRLCSDGLLEDDMEGGFHITNLGAILIARSLRDFPTVHGKSVRVIKYNGRDKQRSEFEQEGTKGYAVGFSRMMRFLMERIPKEEKYTNGVRRSVPLCPEIALREVIANALIHQDFTAAGGGPVVEIYADRIEVTNPGGSLIEPDRMIDDRRSRNEKLASVMRLLGICEERGGGLDKTLIALESDHLPAPELGSSPHTMRVVLFGPKPFSSLSRAERQQACYYHCVIKWLARDFMNNMSLRERFLLTQEEYQSASLVITEAVRAGRIKPAEKNQGKKNARYVPYWA